MPVALLRGENSDLLSAATVTEMQNRNPRLAATTIPNRGHALVIDSGWRDVADTALAFVRRFAEP